MCIHKIQESQKNTSICGIKGCWDELQVETTFFFFLQWEKSIKITTRQDRIDIQLPTIYRKLKNYLKTGNTTSIWSSGKICYKWRPLKHKCFFHTWVPNIIFPAHSVSYQPFLFLTIGVDYTLSKVSPLPACWCLDTGSPKCLSS